MNFVYTQQNLGDLFFGNGYIGVDLFFMVSGFVIMLSTAKDNSCFSFLTKRLFRIYPVYLACLIFTVYAFNKPYDINLLKAIFFINEDITSKAPWFGYTIVFTAWTLMFEIIFYLYFSISMLISWKYRGLLCSSFLIATVCLINAFLGNGLTSSGYAAIPITPDSSNLMYLARVLSSPMFFEFIAGMIIYWVYDKARASHFKDLSVLLMPVSIACFALFYITGYNGGHGVFACGFYAAFLLLSLVIYEKFHKIKSMKSLDYLGNVSYSLYLVHPIVINALGYGVLVTDAYSKTKGFQNIYLIAFISILASTLLFYAIEKPFIKIARYLLTTLKPTNNALNS